MPNFSEQLQKVAPYLNAGTALTASVLLGVFGGHWLDKRLGTAPWLLLACALLGMFSGFYQFVKTIQDLDRKNKPPPGEDHAGKSS